MMKSAILTSAFVLASTLGAQAVDNQSAMEAYLKAQIMPWMTDARIVSAVQAQNVETASLGAAEIDARDQAWRAEIGAGDTPTITPVMMNATSDFLREQVTASAGVMTEVFVMDAVGLNVAASNLTSDYWQGDEDKHQKTYGMGAGAVHYGEIEFDESSQSYQAQISVALTDPATGEVIGAMTVGVNAEQLM